MSPDQQRLFRKHALERAELHYEHAVDWVEFYAPLANESVEYATLFENWVDERNKRLSFLNTMKTQNEE